MIHKFVYDDLRLVLDVHSGSIHVVDELTSKILEYYPRYEKSIIVNKLKNNHSVQEINEVLLEIAELKKQGLLFSCDKVGETFKPKNDQVVKALCLHLAHDCNLRCAYCFAGQGPFGGDRSLMPLHIGEAAIDFLIKSSENRKNIEVDFFGGEPLLNIDVLKKLVDYGREAATRAGKQIKFTVTTNAVLLNDEIAGYISREGLSIVLSLDGRQGVNDIMRPFKSGKGSYEVITSNILNFIKKYDYKDYYIRGTFTRNNLDFAADVIHIAELGLKNISIEPVVGGPEEEYSLRREDIPVLFAEYEKLVRELIVREKQGKGLNFFHFNIDLHGGPCIKKRLSNCGAGNEYVAVTPDGTIYPCHQLVGRENFKMGNVVDGQLKKEIVSYFREAHVYNKSQCPDCWAKFHCSGGCHANAYYFSNSIYKPYELGCELMKKRIECALYLKAREIMNI